MKSIKAKIFVIFLSVVVLAVGLIILLNATLLFKYSIYQNEKIFMKIAYDIIPYAKGKEDVEIMDYFRDNYIETGIEFLVIPAGRRRPPQFHMSPIRPIAKADLQPDNSRFQPNRPNPLQYQSLKKATVSENELDFGITLSPSGQKKNLELNIKLVDDRTIMLIKPIGILIENVQISNEFIMMASAIAIIIGGIFVYFLVDRETKPIISLHRQTEKIAKLDFTDRFDAKGRDEISKLGENINNISDELSKNINALQMANDKLQSDVDILKEVEEMRKQFIAAVSHEFKTPIGVIKSYADGIKYDIADNDEERKRYIDVILDESDRMTGMVKDLVQLMKMELNEYKIEKKSVDLADYLSEIQNRYKGFVKDNNISLTVKEAPKTEVKMDISRITQVIDNFISNAINNMPRYGSITIWAEEVDEGICINVKNTGSHIDEDKLPYIWDSFYKIDKSRNRDMSGSGLGLSIVKGIMEGHGGKYGAKNTDDGIIFFVII
ncbi:HAMP domain-containing sensor histidine kinase [Wukongibacter baidiensis]|uniref:sensor histidine kinase n=1 Tax=Wukongibacter baidiensis TaxID=1723361 RepID=UPI003D7F3AB3